MPILGGWTASRNLDPMASQKFRSWYADHRKDVEQQKRTRTAAAISAAMNEAADREENR